MYCKVIVLENKEVQFLDESGKVVSQKALLDHEYFEPEKYRGRRAILSGKGNFVAIHDYVRKSGDPVDYTIEEEFTICDDRGEEIYRIKGPVEGMALGDRWLISDKDGWAVSTRIAYGALDFYSPTGDIKTVPIFGEVGWGRSTAGTAIFSGNGEYLAVLVGGSPKLGPGLRPFRTDFLVALFDKSGNELWRRKVDERRLGNMAISEHGEYFFFKAFTIEQAPRQRGEPPPEKGERDNLTSVTLSLYDKAGNELSFKDTSLFAFGGFCFSPKADYVALAGANLIRLMRTKDGSVVFEKALSVAYRIRDQLFSADGEHLIVKAETRTGFEKIEERRTSTYASSVWIFNMEGNLVWQEDFPARLRGIFSENGFLAFSSQYKYEIYKKIEKD